MACIYCGDSIDESICISCEDTADMMGIDLADMI